jgi:hypothetical protein
MKGKNVFLALAIILILFLAGCQNITGGAVIQNDPCSSVEESRKDDCYLENQRCSKIKSQQLRDSCVAELAKKKMDLSVCELIKLEKTKNYCREQIAVLTQNQSICLQIDDSYWRDNCHFQLAKDKNNGQYCLKITNEKQRRTCFKEVALATNDVDLCEPLPLIEREGCVFRIAKNLRDGEICQQIRRPFNQDVCRFKIAKLNRDPELCEMISISTIRQECHNLFEAENT